MVGINNPRTQIAIPAQGIQELKGTLTNLIEEFGNEDDRGNHNEIRNIFSSRGAPSRRAGPHLKIYDLIDMYVIFIFSSDSIESPPAIGIFLLIFSCKIIFFI
jgi:hypothetical protein